MIAIFLRETIHEYIVHIGVKQIMIGEQSQKMLPVKNFINVEGIVIVVLTANVLVNQVVKKKYLP